MGRILQSRFGWLGRDGDHGVVVSIRLCESRGMGANPIVPSGLRSRRSRERSPSRRSPSRTKPDLQRVRREPRSTPWRAGLAEAQPRAKPAGFEVHRAGSSFFLVAVSGRWGRSVGTIHALCVEPRGFLGVVPHGFIHALCRIGWRTDLEPTVSNGHRPPLRVPLTEQVNRAVCKTVIAGGSTPRGVIFPNASVAENRAALVKRSMQVTNPVAGSRLRSRHVCRERSLPRRSPLWTKPGLRGEDRLFFGGLAGRSFHSPCAESEEHHGVVPCGRSRTVGRRLEDLELRPGKPAHRAGSKEIRCGLGVKEARLSYTQKAGEHYLQPVPSLTRGVPAAAF